MPKYDKASERILIVDDSTMERRVLQRRHEGRFGVVTAESGTQGLEIIENDGPFAVVVSDLYMPEMSGIEFLREVRRRWPNVIRIMITGAAEVEAAVASVNEGAVFRFLTKPCDPETFATSLEAALEQHRLVTAEKVLLEQTLKSSMMVLTELLGAVNPAAFGRSNRALHLVKQVIPRVALSEPWKVEVASVHAACRCAGGGHSGLAEFGHAIRTRGE